MVSDLQEYARSDEDDYAICGEAACAGVAEYERFGEIEAGRRISTSAQGDVVRRGMILIDVRDVVAFEGIFFEVWMHSLGVKI